MSGKQRWLKCWVAHRLELYLCPAWQSAPRPLRRVLERLEIEHMRHGGMNNGHLYVSFSQFEQYGVSRKSIAPVLKLGEDLGLLQVLRPDDATPRTSDVRAPNRYRLTYLPEKGSKAPTDEWLRLKQPAVEQLVEAFKSTEKRAVKTTRKAAA